MGVIVTLKLIQIAAKYNDIYIFIYHYMRTDKNNHHGAGVRELAKVYQRAHKK